MIFYLGTHRPHWLARSDVPLFVSRRTLSSYQTLPVATAPWALDSGGFSELSMHGRWQTSPKQYATEVERFALGVGRLQWAATQDWMCEPWILKKTGLTVKQHQTRSVDSFLELSRLLPSNIWTPVLQGWEPDDYLRHVEMYFARGVNLHGRLVGVGSVCRRQATAALGEVLTRLKGFQLHGFGVKKRGLENWGHLLHSADSMAWSFRARRAGQQPGCDHKNCANCWKFARRWYDRVAA